MLTPFELILCSFLAVLAIIIIIKVSLSMHTEYETTIEVECEHHHHIIGNLRRHYLGSSVYVYDPADGDKVYVNSTDDLYEDGDGNVWRLV